MSPDSIGWLPHNSPARFRSAFVRVADRKASAHSLITLILMILARANSNAWNLRNSSVEINCAFLFLLLLLASGDCSLERLLEPKSLSRKVPCSRAGFEFLGKFMRGDIKGALAGWKKQAMSKLHFSHHRWLDRFLCVCVCTINIFVNFARAPTILFRQLQRIGAPMKGKVCQHTRRMALNSPNIRVDVNKSISMANRRKRLNSPLFKAIFWSENKIRDAVCFKEPRSGLGFVKLSTRCTPNNDLGKSSRFWCGQSIHPKNKCAMILNGAAYRPKTNPHLQPNFWV